MIVQANKNKTAFECVGINKCEKPEKVECDGPTQCQVAAKLPCKNGDCVELALKPYGTQCDDGDKETDFVRCYVPVGVMPVRLCTFAPLCWCAPVCL